MRCFSRKAAQQQHLEEEVKWLQQMLAKEQHSKQAVLGQLQDERAKCALLELEILHAAQAAQEMGESLCLFFNPCYQQSEQQVLQLQGPQLGQVSPDGCSDPDTTTPPAPAPAAPQQDEDGNQWFAGQEQQDCGPQQPQAGTHTVLEPTAILPLLQQQQQQHHHHPPQQLGPAGQQSDDLPSDPDTAAHDQTPTKLREPAALSASTEHWGAASEARLHSPRRSLKLSPGRRSSPRRLARSSMTRSAGLSSSSPRKQQQQHQPPPMAAAAAADDDGSSSSLGRPAAGQPVSLAAVGDDTCDFDARLAAASWQGRHGAATAAAAAAAAAERADAVPQQQPAAAETAVRSSGSSTNRGGRELRFSAAAAAAAASASMEAAEAVQGQSRAHTARSHSLDRPDSSTLLLGARLGCRQKSSSSSSSGDSVWGQPDCHKLPASVISDGRLRASHQLAAAESTVLEGAAGRDSSMHAPQASAATSAAADGSPSPSSGRWLQQQEQLLLQQASQGSIGCTDWPQQQQQQGSRPASQAVSTCDVRRSCSRSSSSSGIVSRASGKGSAAKPGSVRIAKQHTTSSIRASTSRSSSRPGTAVGLVQGGQQGSAVTRSCQDTHTQQVLEHEGRQLVAEAAAGRAVSAASSPGSAAGAAGLPAEAPDACRVSAASKGADADMPGSHQAGQQGSAAAGDQDAAAAAKQAAAARAAEAIATPAEAGAGFAAGPAGHSSAPADAPAATGTHPDRASAFVAPAAAGGRHLAAAAGQQPPAKLLPPVPLVASGFCAGHAARVSSMSMAQYTHGPDRTPAGHVLPAQRPQQQQQQQFAGRHRQHSAGPSRLQGPPAVGPMHAAAFGGSQAPGPSIGSSSDIYARLPPVSHGHRRSGLSQNGQSYPQQQQWLRPRQPLDAASRGAGCPSQPLLPKPQSLRQAAACTSALQREAGHAPFAAPRPAAAGAAAADLRVLAVSGGAAAAMVETKPSSCLSPLHWHQSNLGSSSEKFHQAMMLAACSNPRSVMRQQLAFEQRDTRPGPRGQLGRGKPRKGWMALF